jgi:predicted transcriptional regulator
MDTEALMELTVDIVTSHVSHNRIDTNDVPRLIQSVYDALAGAGQPAPVVAQKPDPAVSIRSSVKPDAITCLECGAKMKMLKRHLGTDHSTTPGEYRARWGLPATYPMVAPNYAAKRRDLAKKIGLGRKPGTKVQPQTAAERAFIAPEATADLDAEG